MLNIISKRQQTGGSRTDTVVKMALIFFISLFSFSVGTFVGKNVSDSERKKAQLEEDYAKFRGTAAVDPSAMDVQPGKAITDADVSSLTEEFVNTEKEKQGHGETPEHAPSKNENHGVSKNEHGKTAEKVDPHTAKMGEHGAAKGNGEAKTEDGYKRVSKGKAPEKTEAAPAHGEGAHEDAHTEMAKIEHAPSMKKVEPSKAAARVAEGKSPSQDVKAPRTPASVLPGVSGSAVGKYTVQLASYPTEQDAKEQAQKLREKGLEAFYVKAAIRGETWYRVSAGLFDNKDEANSYRSKAMADSGIKSAIVQKILPE